MKYVFIKMFSTFSTIVPNIKYNRPQRLVQLSSILGIFFVLGFLLLI